MTDEKLINSLIYLSEIFPQHSEIKQAAAAIERFAADRAAIEQLQSKLESEIERLVKERDEARLETIAAKPLYSRRQLESRLKEAVEVIRPFISVADQSPSQMAKVIHKGIDGVTPVALTITKEQFQRARQFLKESEHAHG